MRKRRKARELALQSHYAFEISRNPIEDILSQLNSMEELDEEVKRFASSLIVTAVKNRETLDQEVSIMVQNWDFERIALMDRLILRQALCELLFYKEIPPKVTINEAIDLAKKYSTAESGRFVNGVLDGLYKTLKEKNRICKKGRGLLE